MAIKRNKYKDTEDRSTNIFFNVVSAYPLGGNGRLSLLKIQSPDVALERRSLNERQLCKGLREDVLGDIKFVLRKCLEQLNRHAPRDKEGKCRYGFIPDEIGVQPFDEKKGKLMKLDFGFFRLNRFGLLDTVQFKFYVDRDVKNITDYKFTLEGEKLSLPIVFFLVKVTSCVGLYRNDYSTYFKFELRRGKPIDNYENILRYLDLLSYRLNTMPGCMPPKEQMNLELFGSNSRRCELLERLQLEAKQTYRKMLDECSRTTSWLEKEGYGLPGINVLNGITIKDVKILNPNVVVDAIEKVPSARVYTEIYGDILNDDNYCDSINYQTSSEIVNKEEDDFSAILGL